MVKPEVQAAVAVATGSPLVVQLLVALGLLGIGLAYFRFLGGKSHSVTVKTGK
jgi:predicted tellurium resistance membrane protein TerC